MWSTFCYTGEKNRSQIRISFWTSSWEILLCHTQLLSIFNFFAISLYCNSSSKLPPTICNLIFNFLIVAIVSKASVSCLVKINLPTQRSSKEVLLCFGNTNGTFDISQPDSFIKIALH